MSHQSSNVVVQAEVWVGQERFLPDGKVDGRLVEPDGQPVAEVVRYRRPEGETRRWKSISISVSRFGNLLYNYFAQIANTF